jgi:hypothetical protein
MGAYGFQVYRTFKVRSISHFCKVLHLLNESCLVKFQIGEVLGRQNLIGYDLHEIFTALKYVESTRNNNAF